MKIHCDYLGECGGPIEYIAKDGQASHSCEKHLEWLKQLGFGWWHVKFDDKGDHATITMVCNECDGMTCQRCKTDLACIARDGAPPAFIHLN